MFQNNQVKGPYDPDDLSQVPGFSAESLVCPEGRKGTAMGDWQRASMLPELSLTLMKAAQLASAVKTGAGAGFFSSLPPEPTLKDLAALGSLQEKVSLLDNMISHLQDNLHLKENELLSLHKDLEDKNRQAQELALKLGSVEERLAAVDQLQVGLERANAAEKGLEDVIEKQHHTIEELTAKLAALETESAELKAQGAALKSTSEELKAQGDQLKADSVEFKDKESALEKSREEEIAALKKEIEELRNRPAPSAPAPASAPLSSGSPFAPAPREPLSPALGEKIVPLGETKPLGDAKPALQPSGLDLKPIPLGEPSASPFGGGLSSSPGPTPIPLGEPAGNPFGGGPPTGAGPSPIPLGAVPLSGPTPIPLGSSPFDNPLSGSPTFSPLSAPPPSMGAPTPAPTAPPMSGDLTGKPPAKKGPNVLVLAAVGGVVLLGVGFKLKLIPMGGKKAGVAADRTPLPPPNAAAPEPVVPKGPSPEELAEKAKKDAIEMVRQWPVPGGTQTLSQVLEPQSPEAGGLSPWMAEQIKEGIYQVNFYAKSSKGMKTYEFEVNSAEHKVLAHNEPAASLLTPAKPAKGGKKKSGAAKPKEASARDEHVLEDLLQLPSDSGVAPEAPAPAAQAPAEPAAPKPAKPAKKAKAPRRDVNKELDEALSGDEAGAPAKKAAPKKEESLDDLLVPGAGGKGDLKEPQAAPDENPQPAGSPLKKKPAAKKAAGKAEDAQLLDDLLSP